MILYIDLLFLENFILDFFVVFATSRLTGGSATLLRLFAASFFGAIYACLAFTVPFFGNVFSKALSLFLLSYISLGFGNLRSFLKQSAILFLSSLLLGGIMFIFAFYFGDISTSSGGQIFYSLPWWALILASLICTAICFFTGAEIKTKPHKKILDGEIYIGGKKYLIKALYDSGNLCLDPVKNFPVIICDTPFPYEEFYRSSCKTSGGFTDMLIVYPDTVIIYDGIYVYKSTEAAIGIVNKKLDSLGKFNALIGGMYFERAFKAPERDYRHTYFR